MRIAVIGSRGLLGSDLNYFMKDTEHELFPLTQDDLDIRNLAQVKDVLFGLNPDYVVNAAAVTNVDGCETDPEVRKHAHAVNGDAVANLAEVCLDLDSVLIQYSTDYVFDGRKRKGYDEAHHELKPINAYGYSKALGESAIAKIQKWANDRQLKYYLVRPSWLFGKNGKNFVNTMLDLGKKMNEIKVVDDQFGKPTYTRDLAERTLYLIEEKPPFGIYHVTNDGVCSWYEFAKEIFKISGMENVCVVPISSSEYPSKTKRPKCACLNNTKLPPMRPWQNALEDYIQSIN